MEKETTNHGKYVHEFKKPFKYEDKTYEKIEFDFSKLKGRDFLSIEKEVNDSGELVFTASISTRFCIILAARASAPQIGGDVIENMSIDDFSQIRNAARRFLTSTD
ncbi:MAG: phage tail assembly protein [Oscillospiraceae bacterium]|nr:phage tail assembly protein [Oscillospiraceae bacterium]